MCGIKKGDYEGYSAMVVEVRRPYEHDYNGNPGVSHFYRRNAEAPTWRKGKTPKPELSDRLRYDLAGVKSGELGKYVIVSTLKRLHLRPWNGAYVLFFNIIVLARTLPI
jgi:hypothetical protein